MSYGFLQLPLLRFARRSAVGIARYLVAVLHKVTEALLLQRLPFAGALPCPSACQAVQAKPQSSTFLVGADAQARVCLPFTSGVESSTLWKLFASLTCLRVTNTRCRSTVVCSNIRYTIVKILNVYWIHWSQSQTRGFVIFIFNISLFRLLRHFYCVIRLFITK